MRRFSTVSTTTSRNTFSGNGVTTVFPLGFQFFEASSLIVTLVQADGTEVPKTLTTDYTVSGGDGETGSVTTVSFTPATGEELVVERDEPALQGTDYVNNDTFNAETTERRLDRIVMAIQRLGDTFARALVITVGDDVSFSPNLPTTVGQTLKFLRVNSAETALEWAEQAVSTAASSDAVPQEVSMAAGQPGTNSPYSREDHVHQLPQGSRTARRLSLFYHGGI